MWNNKLTGTNGFLRVGGMTIKKTLGRDLVTKRKSLTSGKVRSSGRVHSVAFLSGNNGSWTNTDDLKNRGNAARPRRRNRRRKAPGGVITGSGAYDFTKVVGRAARRSIKSALSHAGRGMGTSLGGNFSPALAIALGSLGKTAGDHIGNVLMGHGDYTMNSVNHNCLYTGKDPPSGASFGNAEHGTRVKHRECLGDLSSGVVSGAFDNNVYYFNPGYTLATFLNQIGESYTEFVVNGFAVEYVSLVSENASTTTLGSIIITAEYNTTSPAYGSKLAMENSGFACSARLDKNLMYFAECAPSQNALGTYFVRIPGTTTPVNLTDPFYVQIATAPSTAIAANTVLGEIWITWDMTFFKPKQTPTLFGHAHINRSGGATATPFGTTNVLTTLVGALSGVTMTSSAINFGSQLACGAVVKCSFQISGTSNAFVLPTFTCTNCSLVGYYGTGASSIDVAPQPGVTTQSVKIDVTIRTETNASTEPVLSISSTSILGGSWNNTDIQLDVISLGVTSFL